MVSGNDHVTPEYSDIDGVDIVSCAFEELVEIVHDIAGSHDPG